MTEGALSLTHVRNVKVRAGLDAADQLRREHDVEAVYLGGSLMAGLGNATSDVDVFVVQRGEASRVPQQLLIAGHRVDVERRTTEWLEVLCRRFETHSILRDATAESRALASSLDDAVRLLNSRVIFAGDHFFALKAQLFETVDAVRRLLINKYAVDALGSVEDLWGNVLADDLCSALLQSQNLVLLALQAYLAGCGDLYMNTKWAWRKLERTAPGLGSALAPLIWGRGEALGWAAVTSRMQWSQCLFAAAQYDGWDSGEAARWDLWPAPVALASDVRPTLRTAWLPVRFTDCVELSCIDRVQVDLSVEGLALFGAMAAQGDESAPRALHQRFEAEQKGISLSEVEQYASALQRIQDVEDPAVQSLTEQAVSS